MKVLLTGAGGMLGRDVQSAFAGATVLAFDKAALDIADQEAVRRVVQAHTPDVVINAAAYTKVDDCETDVDTAYRINAYGAGYVAQAAQEVGAAIVHISTDYVFPGVGARPYREYDATGPQSEYGRSKLAGEQLVRAACERHYIVRTSWLFGMHGANFVKTMLRIGRTQGVARVVDDQVGCPTATADLAQALWELVRQPDYGVYHLTNQGACSWYAFAREIFDQAGVQVDLQPIPSGELARPAPRPAYSVLDNQHWRLTGHAPLRDYREALAAYLKKEASM